VRPADTTEPVTAAVTDPPASVPVTVPETAADEPITAAPAVEADTTAIETETEIVIEAETTNVAETEKTEETTAVETPEPAADDIADNGDTVKMSLILVPAAALFVFMMRILAKAIKEGKSNRKRRK